MAFPFFITSISTLIKNKVESLLAERFEKDDLKDCFLVDISQSKDGRKIEVFVESDKRIKFEQCGIISRYLEGFLDDDTSIPENYILEVSSPGIDRPLKNLRQYKLNLGRKVALTNTSNQKFTGIITEVKDSVIMIELKSKKIESIPFEKIKEAKIKISF